MDITHQAIESVAPSAGKCRGRSEPPSAQDLVVALNRLPTIESSGTIAALDTARMTAAHDPSENADLYKGAASLILAALAAGILERNDLGTRDSVPDVEALLKLTDKALAGFSSHFLKTVESVAGLPDEAYRLTYAFDIDRYSGNLLIVGTYGMEVFQFAFANEPEPLVRLIIDALEFMSDWLMPMVNPRDALNHAFGYHEEVEILLDEIRRAKKAGRVFGGTDDVMRFIEHSPSVYATLAEWFITEDAFLDFVESNYGLLVATPEYFFERTMNWRTPTEFVGELRRHIEALSSDLKANGWCLWLEELADWTERLYPSRSAINQRRHSFQRGPYDTEGFSVLDMHIGIHTGGDGVEQRLQEMHQYLMETGEAPAAAIVLNPTTANHLKETLEQMAVGLGLFLRAFALDTFQERLNTPWLRAVAARNLGGTLAQNAKEPKQDASRQSRTRPSRRRTRQARTAHGAGAV